MTALEFLRSTDFDIYVPEPDNQIETAMVNFAKFHVEQAIKEIIDKVELMDNYQISHTPIINENKFKLECDYYINKNSILNAYSLENIKH